MSYFILLIINSIIVFLRLASISSTWRHLGARPPWFLVIGSIFKVLLLLLFNYRCIKSFLCECGLVGYSLPLYFDRLSHSAIFLGWVARYDLFEEIFDSSSDILLLFSRRGLMVLQFSQITFSPALLFRFFNKLLHILIRDQWAWLLIVALSKHYLLLIKITDRLPLHFLPDWFVHMELTFLMLVKALVLVVCVMN